MKRIENHGIKKRIGIAFDTESFQNQEINAGSGNAAELIPCILKSKEWRSLQNDDILFLEFPGLQKLSEINQIETCFFLNTPPNSLLWMIQWMVIEVFNGIRKRPEIVPMDLYPLPLSNCGLD